MDSISGVISKVNGSGFLLEGRQGWLNLSRFARPAPEIPPVGTRVVVSLDNQGFVRGVEIDDDGRHPAVPATQARLPLDPANRRCALQIAATVMRDRGERVKTPELLSLAEALEEWLAR